MYIHNINALVLFLHRMMAEWHGNFPLFVSEGSWSTRIVVRSLCSWTADSPAVMESTLIASQSPGLLRASLKCPAGQDSFAENPSPEYRLCRNIWLCRGACSLGQALTLFSPNGLRFRVMEPVSCHPTGRAHHAGQQVTKRSLWSQTLWTPEVWVFCFQKRW